MVPVVSWIYWPFIANYWYLLVIKSLHLNGLGEFGDVFGSFNAVFSGLAFAAVAFTIWLSNQESKKEHKRLGKVATIQFFSEGSRRAYEERATLESRFGNNLTSRTLTESEIQEIEACDKLRLAINHVLSFFEELSTGTNEGVFDIDIVDKLLGGGILENYKCFLSYIQHFRSLNGSERFFDQFEKLALALLKRHNRDDALGQRFRFS